MTQEEKEGFARLVQKLCAEEGWHMYVQSVKIPRDLDDIECYETHDLDFGYKERIIIEPPYKKNE